jgi:hypothetical protein
MGVLEVEVLLIMQVLMPVEPEAKDMVVELLMGETMQVVEVEAWLLLVEIHLLVQVVLVVVVSLTQLVGQQHIMAVEVAVVQILPAV